MVLRFLYLGFWLDQEYFDIISDHYDIIAPAANGEKGPERN